MPTVSLSNEEFKLIKAARRERERSEEVESVGILTVCILAQWVEFSLNTGYELTYTTFLEDFDFGGRFFKHGLPAGAGHAYFNELKTIISSLDLSIGVLTDHAIAGNYSTKELTKKILANSQ